MDAFFAITLSVIFISMFWKRERIKAEDRRYEEKKLGDRREKAKEEAVIEKYTAIFSAPLTEAEKKEIQAKKKAEREREQETERLRKQGYTDELIAVILPTINNGQ